MLFALTTAHAIVGLSDAARPVILIVFILLLFVFAGIALFFGKRRIEAQQAAALSKDTGILKGAAKGADTTFDSDWLAAARADDDGDRPRQSWKDAILGPGALHEDVTDDGQVLAPEIRMQRESAAQTQETAWGVSEVGDEPWATGGVNDWATESADTDAPAPVPAYLQPENFDATPAPAPTPAPASTVKPSTSKPASAPFLVDSGLDDED